MTTIRVGTRKRFTQIDRSLVNDKRLSFKARGILVWLLDKPDDWETTAKRIEDEASEGREAVAKALKELETCGYLVRRNYQDEQRKWRCDWTVYEYPQVKPYTAFRKRETVDGKPYALLKTETDTDTRANSSDRFARIPEPRPWCDECEGTGWVERDGLAYECDECAA
jgi:Helix-turn-helix domain